MIPWGNSFLEEDNITQSLKLTIITHREYWIYIKKSSNTKRYTD
jgi:hypothetical protein